ncbi:MAG: hypothetical protein P8Z49_09945 [Acidobacteriota bacterium]
MARTSRYGYIAGLLAGLAAFATSWFVTVALGLVGGRETLPAVVPFLVYGISFLTCGMILGLKYRRGSWVWGVIQFLPWLAAFLIAFILHHEAKQAFSVPEGWVQVSAALFGGCLGGFLGSRLSRLRGSGRGQTSL